MKKPKKIPHFKTIGEMAEFWQTHSAADYENELMEVENPFANPAGAAELWVNLKPREANAVRRIAKARGVRDVPLVRRWIADSIRRETATKRQ